MYAVVFLDVTLDVTMVINMCFLDVNMLGYFY